MICKRKREKVDRNVLFIYLLTVPIKDLGLDFLKKSLFNDQYYLFSNSRSLERPGLIIETLEYVVGLRINLKVCFTNPSNKANPSNSTTLKAKQIHCYMF